MWPYSMFLFQVEQSSSNVFIPFLLFSTDYFESSIGPDDVVLGSQLTQWGSEVPFSDDH